MDIHIAPEGVGTAPPASQCDDVDRSLIRALVTNVRATNRELAEAAGIAERTVANRLRRLREANVLAATLIVDWRLAGYEQSAFVLLTVVDAPVAEVFGALRQKAYVQSASRITGSADIVAHVLAGDIADMRALADDLGSIRGVARVRVVPAVEYHRYIVDRSPLPVPQWRPQDLPQTALALDATDHQLMSCLIDDGHQSNREIARKLKLSENAIRSRLRRLEGSGLMRVVALFSPFALGEAVAACYAVRCQGKARGRVVARLIEHQEAAAVVSCVGEYDVMGALVARAHDEAVAFMDEVRTWPGVTAVTHFPIVGLPHFRLHLGRLLPPP